MQFAAWQYFGIGTGVDTSQYVDDATAIMNGNWSAIALPFHVSYSLLLAVVVMLTGDFTAVVIMQLMISLAAVVVLYRLTFAISGSYFSAFVAAMLFVLWPDFSQWNFFVYTDSLFANMVVMSLTVLYFRKYALATIFIVVTMFVRPVGVVFFISLLAYLATPGKYVTGVLVLIALVTVNFVLRGSINSFLLSYQNAEIIYPGISLGVQAPSDLSIPSSDHQPIVRLLLFTINNPVYFLKIFFMKATLFVGHVKPYFSVVHNVLIAFFLYPLYIMAAAGVTLLNRASLKRFIIFFIILQVVMVGLTSENWDGRFLLPVLPWVFILSSLGIGRFLKNRMSWTHN